jgi:hypothetical protein
MKNEYVFDNRLAWWWALAEAQGATNIVVYYGGEEYQAEYIIPSKSAESVIAELQQKSSKIIEVYSLKLPLGPQQAAPKAWNLD